MPIKHLIDWFTTELVSGKREEIQRILHSLMERNNLNIDELNLPQLVFGSKSIDDMVRNYFNYLISIYLMQRIIVHYNIFILLFNKIILLIILLIFLK